MLKWFIEDDKVGGVLKNRGELVSEQDVEVRPDSLLMQC